MTQDESDLRLRGIYDEWQRWCKGPGANVSFVSTPIARAIDTPGPCEPLTHVPTPTGKDSRGWTRFTCRRCGVFFCYGPPDAGAGARPTPSASTVSQGSAQRNSRSAAR